MTDPITNVLGLPEPEKPARQEMILPGDGDEYAFVRDNLSKIVIEGQKALEELKEISELSQHPGAYKAYAELTNSVVNAAKEIMLAKKTQSSITGDSGPTTINNTLIMTPDEVLKHIKSKKNG